jgi:hypothetical protein
MRRVTSPLTAASSLQHMLEQTDGSSDERAIADSRKRRAARKPSSSKARKRKQNL